MVSASLDSNLASFLVLIIEFLIPLSFTEDNNRIIERNNKEKGHAKT
jgi:hypothetical protein